MFTAGELALAALQRLWAEQGAQPREYLNIKSFFWNPIGGVWGDFMNSDVIFANNGIRPYSIICEVNKNFNFVIYLLL